MGELRKQALHGVLRQRVVEVRFERGERVQRVCVMPTCSASVDWVPSGFTTIENTMRLGAFALSLSTPDDGIFYGGFE